MAHRSRGGLLFGLGLKVLVGRRLLRQVDAAEGTQQDAGHDHADDGEGISHRVACCQALGGAFDAQVGDRLLGCREAWSVGDGTRVDTRHIGQVLMGNLRDQEGDEHTQSHVDDDHEVHRQTAFPEGAEEAGAHLKAHSHHEEDETELLDDVQHLGVEADAAGAEGDADEEHPGDAQGYFRDFDSAQEQSDEDGEGQIKDSGTDARTGEEIQHTLLTM